MRNAMLILSYGGPTCLDDIEPFLDAVLCGKRVPEARRAAVREKYARFNGVSPLPEETLKFAQRIRDAARDDVRVYVANIYSAPTCRDAIDAMRRDDVKSVFALPTAPFAAPQICQKYRGALKNALEEYHDREFVDSLDVAFPLPFFDRPALRRAAADSILEALAWDELDSNPFASKNENATAERMLLFVAHSLPCDDAERALYREQILDLALGAVELALNAPSFGRKPQQPATSAADASFCPPDDARIDAARRALRKRGLDFALAFQSRSGSPATPWLEPDVNVFLRDAKRNAPALKRVIVAPIGFFLENMETAWDLDVELRATCDAIGLSYRRATCCGADVRVADDVLKLAQETRGTCPLRGGVCDFSCRRAAVR